MATDDDEVLPMSAEAVLVAVMDTSPAGADSDASWAAASTVVLSVVVTIETPIAMAPSLTATPTAYGLRRGVDDRRRGNAHSRVVAGPGPRAVTVLPL